MRSLQFAVLIFASVIAHAQTQPLNIEPENPPGYNPLVPTQTQPTQGLSPQGLSKQPSAAPDIPSMTPIPSLTPISNAPTSASSLPQSGAGGFPPGYSGAPVVTAPGQSPIPFATPSTFQDSSDLSKAANAIPKFDANAPRFGPSYPPTETKSKPKQNLIEEYSGPGESKKLMAVVMTSMGTFKIRLYPQYAPRTVKNFTDLATGQKEFVEATTSRKSTRPFYNGQIIFKVVKNFVVQMGCPFGDGRGGPGYEINDEFSPYLHHNKPGMVSMANHGPNTGGSQFFINLTPQASFDDVYPIFGEVVSGMDVVNKIARVKTGPTSRPLKRIVLERIDIEGKL